MSQVSLAPAERRTLLIRQLHAFANRERWSVEDVRRFDTIKEQIDECNFLLEGTRHSQYYRAFDNYLRRGFDNITLADQKELRATLGVEVPPTGGAYPGSTSGYFAPLEFQKEVLSATKYVGPMLDEELVTIDRTSHGAPKGYPQDDDVSVSGEQVVEGQQFTQQDINIKLSVLGSYKYTSHAVICSMEEVQDVGFDLMVYLTKRFAVRIGRVLNPVLTNGTGSGQPTGFLNGLTPSVTCQGSSDTDGDETTGENIGMQDLVALEQALDPSRRFNATWMFHPNTLSALRNVKNKQGEPVFWTLDNDVRTLLGYRVALNPSMNPLFASANSPAQNQTVLAFGDFKAYTVRLVQPTIRRLTERYIDLGKVAFVLYQRCDANLTDGQDSSYRAIVTAQQTF